MRLAVWLERYHHAALRANSMDYLTGRDALTPTEAYRLPWWRWRLRCTLERINEWNPQP